MPKSPREILEDPNFKALPLGEQLKVMRTVDPNFALLPPKEQGTVLYRVNLKKYPSEESMPDKDKGFFRTLGTDFMSLFTPNALPRAIAAQREQFTEGTKAFKEGRPVEGSGRYLAGALPLIGPLAAETGQDIAQGKYGEAGAHLIELGLPFAHDVPIPEALKSTATKVGKTAISPPVLKSGIKTGVAIGAAVKDPLAAPWAIEHAGKLVNAVKKAWTGPKSAPEIDPERAKLARNLADRQMRSAKSKPTRAPVVETKPTPAPKPASNNPSPQFKREGQELFEMHARVKKAAAAAQSLYKQGVTAKDLEAMPPSDRAKALGSTGKASDQTFQSILFELRGLETGKIKP